MPSADLAFAGIINVIRCANSAFDRRDTAAVAQTCSILMSRIHGHRRSVQDNFQMDTALQSLATRLHRYFIECNQRKLRYGDGLEISWCSGIAAITSRRQLDVNPSLICAFGTGVSLGLVRPEYEEAEIWDRLSQSFASNSDAER